MLTAVLGAIFVVLGIACLLWTFYQMELFKSGDKYIGYATNSQVFQTKARKTIYYKTTYSVNGTYVTEETPELIKEGTEKEFVLIKGKYKSLGDTKGNIQNGLIIMASGIGMILFYFL